MTAARGAGKIRISHAIGEGGDPIHGVIYLLILLNALSFAAQSIFLKRVGVASWRDNILVTAAFTLLAGVPLLLWTLGSGTPIPAYTWGMGVLYGLLFSAAFCTYTLAMSLGALSYSNFVFSASMIIPSIAGILLWGEALSPLFQLALLLFLCAFYLICAKGPGAERGRLGLRWAASAFSSFLFSGLAMLALKIHQLAMEGAGPMIPVGIGFCTAGAVCLLVYLLTGARAESSQGARALLGGSGLPILMVALATCVGNVVQTYLSSRVPGAYLYPIVLGGSMVLVTLASVWIYGEALDRRGRWGLFLGFCAIVVLNL